MHRVPDEVALNGETVSEHGVIVCKSDLDGPLERVDLSRGERGDVAVLGFGSPGCVDLLLGKTLVRVFETPEEIGEGHVLFEAAVGRIAGGTEDRGGAGEVFIASAQKVREVVLHAVSKPGRSKVSGHVIDGA